MREAIVTGVISGVVSGIILFFLYLSLQRVIRWCTSEEFKIVLEKLPENILTKGFKFGVLYVQNEDGAIKNTTHWFKRRGKDKLYVTIRHPRNLGFQYKCFVDNRSGKNFSQISTDLTGLGYMHVSKSPDIRNRIWFILPNTPTAIDARRNLNNYYYPQ
jgi:hypothetical protein